VGEYNTRKGNKPAAPYAVFSARQSLFQGRQASKPERPMPENSEIERLEHRIHYLELLCAEYRAKIKRLAVDAAYYARKARLVYHAVEDHAPENP
jgi:hypothetical protein